MVQTHASRDIWTWPAYKYTWLAYKFVSYMNIWISNVTYNYAMVQTHASPYIWMYEWVMSHVKMACYKCMSHVTRECISRRVLFICKVTRLECISRRVLFIWKVTHAFVPWCIYMWRYVFIYSYVTRIYRRVVCIYRRVMYGCENESCYLWM